jgi:hypothetical protein
VNGRFAEFLVFKRQVSIDDLYELINKRVCQTCYLVINWRIGELVELGRWQVPMDAYKELADHVYAYIYEDKMPPEPISQIVLNVADDFVRNEPIRLRGGDYIALNNYMRNR